MKMSVKSKYLKSSYIVGVYQYFIDQKGHKWKRKFDFESIRHEARKPVIDESLEQTGANA
ncbi:hypothetical protein ACFWMS_25190 [Peribacillus butanolivorans]|uniref:hypothetical protein n=1 Tax=Peribacillus butanolivorans TaxID=421767 RepID=UPI00365B4891